MVKDYVSKLKVHADAKKRAKSQKTRTRNNKSLKQSAGRI